MAVQFLQSNPGNFTVGRAGHPVIMGIFHRTAISGDTAIGEATYSHNHVLKASYYKVIDYDGHVVESVLPGNTEWAADNYPINQISLNYEFTGKNGTPLTHAQITAAIVDIRADAATKHIANHVLSLTELVRLNISGWCSHHDVTNAYHIYGGHTDAISSSELAQILHGVYAVPVISGGGRGPAIE